MKKRLGLPEQFVYGVGRMACLAAMLSQLALPLAHEWQVAREEAGHHQNSGPVSYPIVQESPYSESHHHHDPSSCSICPTLVRYREWVVAYASVTLDPPPIYAHLADAPKISDFFLDLTASSPRGPPTV